MKTNTIETEMFQSYKATIKTKFSTAYTLELVLALTPNTNS